MKNYLFILFILFLLIACNEKIKQPSISKIIFYTDSTFTIKKDSINTDSLNASLTGFVKIYGYGGINSFEQGELKKGKKTGIWKKYFTGKNLSELITFNQLGEKDGISIEFDSNKDTISFFNFKKDQQIGRQKEFLNGKLTLQYFTNTNYNFINNYFALKPKGDTLYSINLGHKGSGYLKQYDRFGILNKEGYLKNGIYQDTVKEYFYDYGANRYEYVTIYFYKNDSATFVKKTDLK